MINNFFYEGQLRAYLRQFMAVFYGLQVKTGRGECEEEFITVPCVMGSKDRVVAALFAGNTQNRVISVPAMAVFMQNLEIANERRKVPSMLDQRVVMPVGGVFPTDLTVLKRAMPVPYDMDIELSILASNTEQLHQILEQILVLFNPDLQIQRSDSPYDWTVLTNVLLTGINNEENYPAGDRGRLITWTLNFRIPIFLSVPQGVKDDLVRKIIIDIAGNTNKSLEVDEDGNLVPFGNSIASIVIDQENYDLQRKNTTP